MIIELAPDLILLDIQMPGASGLDVAASLGRPRPAVIFCTAFDQYAVDAFELSALDYLLKPVQLARLQETLERARARRHGPDAGSQSAALASAQAILDHPARTPFPDRLPLRQKDAVVLVPVRSIASVEADGELLRIRTVTNETYTVTHRLHALESRLDGRRFLRLSRGTLANVDHITHVHAMPGSTYSVVLRNGQELPVSRIQSRVLRDTLLKL